jgi:hypothetical protein
MKENQNEKLKEKLSIAMRITPSKNKPFGLQKWLHAPKLNNQGGGRMIPIMKPKEYEDTPSPIILLSKTLHFQMNNEDQDSSFNSKDSTDNNGEKVYNSDGEKEIEYLKNEVIDNLTNTNTFKRNKERNYKKINTIKLIPEHPKEELPVLNITNIKYKIGPSNKNLLQSNIIEVMASKAKSPRNHEEEKELFNFDW